MALSLSSALSIAAGVALGGAALSPKPEAPRPGKPPANVSVSESDLRQYVIVGERRVGGYVADLTTHRQRVSDDADREYLSRVIALCKAELDGFAGIYLGDDYFDLVPNGGHVPHTGPRGLIPAWGKYRKVVSVHVNRGAPGESNADFWLWEPTADRARPWTGRPPPARDRPRPGLRRRFTGASRGLQAAFGAVAANATG